MIESGAGGSETRLLLEIWELLDIMLIDPRVERISSTELLTKLLKWSAGNNDKINELELKAFRRQVFFPLFYFFLNFLKIFFPTLCLFLTASIFFFFLK